MSSLPPLTAEHHLIRRVLHMLLTERCRLLEDPSQPEVILTTRALDFIEPCGCQTHRVEEDAILFPTLRVHPLSAENFRALDELAREHESINVSTKEPRDAWSKPWGRR